MLIDNFILESFLGAYASIFFVCFPDLFWSLKASKALRRELRNALSLIVSWINNVAWHRHKNIGKIDL